MSRKEDTTPTPVGLTSVSRARLSDFYAFYSATHLSRLPHWAGPTTAGARHPFVAGSADCDSDWSVREVDVAVIRRASASPAGRSLQWESLIRPPRSKRRRKSRSRESAPGCPRLHCLTFGRGLGAGGTPTKGTAPRRRDHSGRIPGCDWCWLGSRPISTKRWTGVRGRDLSRSSHDDWRDNSWSDHWWP